MRNNLVLIVFIFLIPMPFYGQVSQEIEGLNVFKREVEFRNQTDMKTSKVSHYLTDWEGGVVYTNDDKVITGKLFRYNVYTDQVEVREILNPEDVDVIAIGTKKFIFSQYKDEGLDYSGYFEMLVSGETKLLIKRKLLFEQGNKSVQAYGSEDSFRIKPEYYIQKEDGTAIKINKDKNLLMDALGDKEEMKKYIKKKSFPFLIEKSLISIVKHYNNI